MKKKLISLVLTFIMSLGFVNVFAQNSNIDKEVINLVTTFYGDAKTTRAFAWSTTSNEYYRMAIRYAPADVDFDTNYKEVRAKNAGNPFNDKNTGIKFIKTNFKADISDLTPGTKYIYKIGDLNVDVWTKEYSFTTEGENENNFSFIAVNDPQGTEEKHYNSFKQLIDVAMSDEPDLKFILSLGDMVMQGNVEDQWEWHFDAIRKHCTSIPYMAILGNHEVYGITPSGATNFSFSGRLFRLYFNNPKNGGKAAIGELSEDDVNQEYSKNLIANIEESIYSFDYGNAHFVVLNSGSNQDPADCLRPLLTAQKEWLKNDLKNSNAKWKIVMLHQGLYPADEKNEIGQRKILESLLVDCKVDLVLHGHDHIMMRTYPMKNGQIVTKENPDEIIKGTGIIHLEPGHAGEKRNYDELKAPSYTKTFINSGPTTYSLFNVSDGKLEVITKDVTGQVIDSFKIVDAGYTESAQYTITLKTDSSNKTTSEVASGEAFKKPEDPTKAGYTFAGWYADDRFLYPYDFGTPVTKNTTLYAKWEIGESPVVEKPSEETPTDGNPFVDVKMSNWYYNAVMFAYNNNITSGVSENMFAPSDKVTRGQFMTMLCRAYGIDAKTGDNFADAGDTWYTGYLAAAKQLGISNGVGDNMFAPDKNITREEMVTLIYNYLKTTKDITAPEGNTNFADDDSISTWAKPGVIFSFENGYVNGKQDNCFAPKDLATRAELVQIFMNIFSK